eukprot:1874337-Amphidinium_carterae.1
MGSKRRRTRKPWTEEVDDPRQHALLAWLRIMTDREHGSMVGKQLKMLDTEAERMESLVDTLAEKATATIRIVPGQTSTRLRKQRTDEVERFRSLLWPK